MNEFPTNKLLANFNSDVYILRNELIMLKHQVNFNSDSSIFQLFQQSKEASEMASYKIYTALISQTDEINPPTAIILENTLGTLTWAKDSVGVYSVNSSGLFTVNKTFVSINQCSDWAIPSNARCEIMNVTSNYIQITSFISNDPEARQDANLQPGSSIEIRVYS